MSIIYSANDLVITLPKSLEFVNVTIGNQTTSLEFEKLVVLVEALQKHVVKVENHNALEAMITQSVAIHGPEKTQGFIDNLLKPLKKVRE